MSALFFAIPVLSFPLTAFAQGGTQTACDLVSRLATIVGLFGSIVLIVAFAILLYASYLFITGGANEEARKQAKTVLIWALVGLAVAFLATLADDIVRQLVGGNISEACPRPQGL